MEVIVGVALGSGGVVVGVVVLVGLTLGVCVCVGVIVFVGLTEGVCVGVDVLVLVGVGVKQVEEHKAP